MQARRTRRTEARQIREEAAELAAQRLHPDHLGNGEELEYRRPAPPLGNGRLSYIANYSKGLPHNAAGEVNQSAYEMLLRALHSGSPDDFEQIRLGRFTRRLRLTNPQGGLAFDLEGPDAHAVTIPAAPRIDSAQNSAEMAEVYWMALLRDVAFNDYSPAMGANALVGDAAGNLSTFSDFRAPKEGTPLTVTRRTLFRGLTRGDLVGPYISQFLLKGNADAVLNPPPDGGHILYGTLRVNQRQRTVRALAAGGRDFLTNYADWLAVQRGRDDRGNDIFDPTRRFIRNLRDLANWVHFDALYEAYLNACLFLLSMPARLDPGNPYVRSRKQDGFATFGNPHILSLVTEVATRALKAVWFQKWGVHRRLRPEEFGGRIQVHLRGAPGIPAGRYPMINGEILRLIAGTLNPTADSILDRIRKHNIKHSGHNTFLLPQVFSEGAPTHPAYGAGHATVAGACTTVLKAWFDESDVFDPDVAVFPANPAREAELKENRRPKVPNAAGTDLADYVAPAGEPKLTVGGELNKLAGNISLGRNAAGVHWRSDYTESVKLGEEIAIRILQEQRLTYNEDHHLSLTRFDGNAITI